MTHIIPIQDLKDTSATSQMYNASSEPIFITQNCHNDIYVKMSQAEDDICANKTVDARDALKEMRARHGL